MKHQEFATHEFIGLKTLNKLFLRANFTFRAHELTIKSLVFNFLYKFENLKNYIEEDY